ncbi:GNAT family N-acetyltransferase [Bacillus sp. 196mf]|uniref:GNAT family N-acetyltransferase n=1 Tax=Bacillus sp. 196mf TaxID=1761754 RepID=UPI000D938579|nr:GNAT family N-acetyltransferase [Bacillus sp. 196mf]PYE87380.1 ribosomal-protein-alanine N-acetyltransferase [Bacillus sp. 196mf]
MATIFENNSIRIREASIADAEELFRIISDQDVMEYYGMKPCANLEGAKEEILWFQSLAKNNQGFRWIIADKKSNKYIGDIGVFGFEPIHNRIEIGFKLQQAHWNKGIMSECIQKVLEFSFLKNQYNRVEALVDPRNKGCQMTLKKSGFTLEGTLREYEFENGQYIDLQLYSIIKREFIVYNSSVNCCKL